jgi:hypothetical protein
LFLASLAEQVRSSGNAALFYTEIVYSNFGWDPSILTEDFRSFSQPRYYLKLGHDRFLRLPLHFIINCRPITRRYIGLI